MVKNLRGHSTNQVDGYKNGFSLIGFWNIHLKV